MNGATYCSFSDHLSKGAAVCARFLPERWLFSHVCVRLEKAGIGLFWNHLNSVPAPLLMLGGGTCGADEFIPHATSLGKSYLTIRLQTLNISRSREKQPLPRDYSIATEVAAVDETLKRLGVRVPVDFVGHSLGALIALQFALEHPEKP